MKNKVDKQPIEKSPEFVQQQKIDKEFEQWIEGLLFEGSDYEFIARAAWHAAYCKYKPADAVTSDNPNLVDATSGV